MAMNARYDVDAIKRAANGKTLDILHDLCGVPNDVIDAALAGNNREFPCPKCGGSTRFRVTSFDRGRVYCSHCCRDKSEGSGDFLSAVKWFNDCSFSEALSLVADYLGVEPTTGDSSVSASRHAPTVAPPRREERVDVYYYETQRGERLWRVVRTERPDGSKTFKQERFENGGWVAGLLPDPNDGKKAIPVPYNACALKATLGLIEIYVVEGEKCADALNELFRLAGTRRVATTLAGGSSQASRWRLFVSGLPRVPVVVLGDDDKPGRKAVDETVEAFRNAGFDVRAKIFDAPPTFRGAGYDVADWIADRRAEGLTDLLIFDRLDRETRQEEKTNETPSEGLFVKIRSLDEYEDRDFEWIWPGYFPTAGISLVGGEPGVGKSTLLAWFAASLSVGRPFPNEPFEEREPCSVLMFRGEDDVSRVVKKKAAQFGADLSKIIVFEEFTEAGKFVPPSLQRLDSLAAAVDATERKTGVPCRAIFVDPISIAWGDGVDSNKQTDVRAVLRPLQVFVEERNLAAILVTHLRKSGTNDKSSLKDRFIGAIDVIAAARVAYLLRSLRKRPGYSEMRCVKSNCFDYRNVDALQWTMDANGELYMDFDAGKDDDFDAEPKKSKKEEKEEAARRWVLNYFSEHGTDDPEHVRTVRRGQYKPGDDADGIWVAAKNNDLLARDTIREALSALRVEAWNFKKEYYFSLPHSEPADG